MPSTFFQGIFSTYNAALIAGMQTAITNLLTAAHPYLLGAVELTIIIFAGMMTFNRMTLPEGAVWILRTVIVSALLSIQNYNTFVTQTFTTTVPNAIAQTIGGAASGLTVPQQFDTLHSAISHTTASLLLVTDANILLMGAGLSVRVADEFATLMLVCCWLIDFIATALAAIVVPAGSVLIIFYLFNNTRHFAERWIGKLVSLMLLQLFVAILLVIITQQFRNYGLQAEQLALSGNVDLNEQIDLFWSVGWAFAIGLLLLIALPGIAASIGGGHVSAVVITHMRFGSIAASRITAAVAKGIRAGAAARAAGTTTP